MKIIRVAVPGPFREGLDYRYRLATPTLVGCRVIVPLGNRQVIGIVVRVGVTPKLSPNKLKDIIDVVDEKPLFAPPSVDLLTWVSHYYHHAIGEVFFTTLPKLLAHGEVLCAEKETVWELSETGKNTAPDSLARAPRQQACFAYFKQQQKPIVQEVLIQTGFKRATVKALVEKKLLRESQQTILPEIVSHTELPHHLNDVQSKALHQILASHQKFKTFLLHGVTGSGKTEVYLQAIQHVLTHHEQALVLVPEIGLTPQTLTRFRERFNLPVVAYHSQLTEKEKRQCWYFVKNGIAKIVIGTRSAVFLPFESLGMIVVDEAHDLSFKQQSGLRYHARDVAIMRGHYEKLPVVLGSATPSLESMYNASTGKFSYLALPTRVGGGKPPKFHIVDMKKQPLNAGISKPMLAAIEKHLAHNQQVLLFLNRRGFAPVLMCHGCGWVAQCPACDAYYTLHRSPIFLSCHHCGRSQKMPSVCPDCHQSEYLVDIGVGTEKLEEHLKCQFPEKRIVRLDRSSTQTKGSLDTLLTQAAEGEADILVGTQMLAKGHHFERVSMVGIVDVDRGLFSADFRATERLGQLVMQVSGRAGRAGQASEVYLQTHQPEHPLLQILLKEDYRTFVQALLAERQLIGWPPYSHLCLVRAEDVTQEIAKKLLQQLRETLSRHYAPYVQILGPVPALMQKRAGFYRFQLLLQSKERKILKQAVEAAHQWLSKHAKRRIRWALDIDAQEVT